ncbi:MAG: HAMP domain-containing sensor histidine kinase [Peptoniphilaceae bacterium]
MIDKKRNIKINSLRKKVLILLKLFTIFVLAAFIFLERQNFKSEATYIILISSIVLILVLILDFFIKKLVTDPIAHITKVANSIENFDYNAKSNINSKDELGLLSKSINKMLEKLKNENTLLEENLEKEKVRLLQRKEFIEHLSHEMKTPLSVIQAHAIGILDEKNQDKKDKYAETIASEVDIVNDMVNSLLKLSELESGLKEIKYEHFDLVELVETVAGRLLMDLPRDEYNLSYDLPDEKVIIYADIKMIENALINLIMNAINYSTGDKGIHISICENKNNGEIKFSIYNECEHLDEIEANRIWEKFYRRDKTSSKIGSGLGLSIVSTILDLHRFKYTSKWLADGLEIEIVIPKK